MGIKYLSDEWFTKVDELTEELNWQVADQLKEAKLNFTVTDKEGDIEYALDGGKIIRGHIDDATTRLIVPREDAYKMFILQDRAAGMAAFTAGKLKVEGDASILAAMQDIEPTESGKLLTERIKEITEE